jgi:hypothetical protein
LIVAYQHGRIRTSLQLTEHLIAGTLYLLFNLTVEIQDKIVLTVICFNEVLNLETLFIVGIQNGISLQGTPVVIAAFNDRQQFIRNLCIGIIDFLWIRRSEVSSGQT